MAQISAMAAATSSTLPPMDERSWRAAAAARPAKMVEVVIMGPLFLKASWAHPGESAHGYA